MLSEPDSVAIVLDMKGKFADATPMTVEMPMLTQPDSNLARTLRSVFLHSFLGIFPSFGSFFRDFPGLVTSQSEKVSAQEERRRGRVESGTYSSSK